MLSNNIIPPAPQLPNTKDLPDFLRDALSKAQADFLYNPFEELQKALYPYYTSNSVQANLARHQKEILEKPLARLTTGHHSKDYTHEDLAEIFLLAIANVNYFLAMLRNKTLRQAILEKLALFKHTPGNGALGLTYNAFQLFNIAYDLKKDDLLNMVEAIEKQDSETAAVTEAERKFDWILHKKLNDENPYSSLARKTHLLSSISRHHSTKKAFILLSKQSNKLENANLMGGLHLLSREPNANTTLVPQKASYILHAMLRNKDYLKALDFKSLKQAIDHINSTSSNMGLSTSVLAIVRAFKDGKDGLSLAKLCLSNAHIYKKLDTEQLLAFAEFDSSLALHIIDTRSLNKNISAEHVVKMVCKHPDSRALKDRAFSSTWFGKNYKFTDAQWVEMAIANPLARNKIIADRDLCFKIMKTASLAQLEALDAANPTFLPAVFNKVSATRLGQTNYIRLFTSSQNRGVTPDEQQRLNKQLLYFMRYDEIRDAYLTNAEAVERTLNLAHLFIDDVQNTKMSRYTTMMLAGILNAADRYEFLTEKTNAFFSKIESNNSSFRENNHFFIIELLVRYPKFQHVFFKQKKNLAWLCNHLDSSAQRYLNSDDTAQKNTILYNIYFTMISLASNWQKMVISDSTLLRVILLIDSDVAKDIKFSKLNDIRKIIQQDTDTRNLAYIFLALPDLTREQRNFFTSKSLLLRLMLSSDFDPKREIAYQPSTPSPHEMKYPNEPHKDQEQDTPPEISEQKDQQSLQDQKQKQSPAPDSLQAESLNTRQIPTLLALQYRVSRTLSETFLGGWNDTQYGEMPPLHLIKKNKLIGDILLKPEILPSVFDKIMQKEVSEFVDLASDVDGRMFIGNLIQAANDDQKNQFIKKYLTACLPTSIYLPFHDALLILEIIEQKKKENEAKALPLADVILEDKESESSSWDLTDYEYLNQDINKLREATSKNPERIFNALNEVLETCCSELAEGAGIDGYLNNSQDTIEHLNLSQILNIKAENVTYITKTILNAPPRQLVDFLAELSFELSLWFLSHITTYLSGEVDTATRINNPTKALLLQYDPAKIVVIQQAIAYVRMYAQEYDIRENIFARIIDIKSQPGTYTLLTMLEEETIYLSKDWNWEEISNLINAANKYRTLLHQLAIQPEFNEALHKEEWYLKNGITTQNAQLHIERLHTLIQQTPLLKDAILGFSPAEKPKSTMHGLLYECNRDKYILKMRNSRLLAEYVIKEPVARELLIQCLNGIHTLDKKWGDPKITLNKKISLQATLKNTTETETKESADENSNNPPIAKQPAKPKNSATTLLRIIREEPQTLAIDPSTEANLLAACAESKKLKIQARLASEQEKSNTREAIIIAREAKQAATNAMQPRAPADIHSNLSPSERIKHSHLLVTKQTYRAAVNIAIDCGMEAGKRNKYAGLTRYFGESRGIRLPQLNELITQLPAINKGTTEASTEQKSASHPSQTIEATQDQVITKQEGSSTRGLGSSS